ncbi:hypothetical protein HPB51_015195 [Rhipicephalus microplus]|uniref:Secreted protein n=1 Tax=Rhipicephalus microplus TaxID=6941 RepID=A0A9J6DHC4_RHIMP|nr:hypothetical protein HPB51_015195 [Rhipicephalus microplus]
MCVWLPSLPFLASLSLSVSFLSNPDGKRVQPLSRLWHFVERNYTHKSLQTVMDSLSDVLVRIVRVTRAMAQSTQATQQLHRFRLKIGFRDDKLEDNLAWWWFPTCVDLLMRTRSKVRLPNVDDNSSIEAD